MRSSERVRWRLSGTEVVVGWIMTGDRLASIAGLALRGAGVVSEVVAVAAVEGEEDSEVVIVGTSGEDTEDAGDGELARGS